MPDEIGKVDITPSPRVLRVLGEIPFTTWQCIAELMDNSIDAHLAQPDVAGEQKAVYVTWSGRDVAASERTLEVRDNAMGMNPEQMRKAVSAGYSGNDPIGNLGLFGMGFNIATARLGSLTEIWSTTSDSDVWYGIKIDFDELKTGGFEVPLLTKEKDDQSESGTAVIVKRFNTGVESSLAPGKEREIRRTLEDVYAPLLMDGNVDLYVQGKILHPKKPCVWGENRYVIYEGHEVPAVIHIDEQLGESLFDLERNSYLSPDEADKYWNVDDADLPENICKRERHLHGWVGIQRYSDPDDFGIDFVRNGRKILMKDKSLFSYRNPITGNDMLQYPVELGSTVGGRIVGQLHVDYMLPTYQKNDFNRYDPTWTETVDLVRGDGPLKPRSRKDLGFPPNLDSPIGLLFSAYRRPDAGTKHLALERDTERKFLAEFNKGNPEYQSDERWWQAALEADRKKSESANPPASAGDEAADDILDIIDIPADIVPESEVSPEPKKPVVESSTAAELKRRSEEVVTLGGEYDPSGPKGRSPVVVRAYRLKSGEIKLNGERVPFLFTRKNGRVQYFYDPTYPLIRQYPVSPRQYLLVYLAQFFSRRDHSYETELAFANLVELYMRDERVDPFALREQSTATLARIREPLIELLRPIAPEVVECVEEAKGEFEEALNAALADGRDWSEVKPDGQTSYVIVEYAPLRTLVRLVERFPERLMDKKLFSLPYESIISEDEAMQERLRKASKDRVIAYLKDLLAVTESTGAPGQGMTKNDLTRAKLSFESLMEVLVDGGIPD